MSEIMAGSGGADAVLARMLRALQTLDPADDDAARIDQIRALEELKSAAAAVQARVTAAFVASQRQANLDRGVRAERAERAERGIAAQVGLARRSSPYRAARYVGWAQVLTRELPGTFAALQSGQTTEYRAMLVARETLWLSRQQRAVVDRQLAPRLGEWGDRQVEVEAKRAAYRLDPAGFTERLGRAESERRVGLRPAPEALARLSALLPVADGVAAYATLGRDADAAVAAGDGRTRGQLMADLLVERVTGRSPAVGMPVEVELVMPADTLLAGDCEPAHVQGYGPVPGPAARGWLLDPRRESPVWIRRLFAEAWYRAVGGDGVPAAHLHDGPGAVPAVAGPDLPYPVLRGAGAPRGPRAAGRRRRPDRGRQRAGLVRGLQLRQDQPRLGVPDGARRCDHDYHPHRTRLPQPGTRPTPRPTTITTRTTRGRDHLRPRRVSARAGVVGVTAYAARHGNAGAVVVTDRISAAAARRIALAAQGFADRRPAGRVDARHIRRVLDRIGVLQLDSVNVFLRSHYMPIFSRLGPYPRDLLDRLSAHTAGRVRRELFEYWAHEASLVPLALQPYLRWRMQRAGDDAWGRMRRLAREQPALLAEVLDLVRERGPIRAGATGPVRAPREPGAMWNWHEGKVALEFLFWSGAVTAARRVNFERHYDLPERVLPAHVLATETPPVEHAQRELLRVAARACGVATEADLGDYFRLPRAESKARVAELADAGELTPVRVEGWREPAYLWPEARRPRRVSARALLSPFDSLIWHRPRAERLFGFRYRLEIYTPPERREHGYYVLPFLLGEQLVARVDLKSDRALGVLRVQAAHVEPGAEPGHVASQLADELASVAGWLGLGAVEVMPRGGLAQELAAAVKLRG